MLVKVFFLNYFNMEYHFIRMKPTKTYLSVVDPNSKSRFVCFGEKRIANTFMDYVINFRSQHGYWPNIDMSNKFSKIQSKTGVKKRTPDELQKYLDLDTFGYDDIDEMAKSTNISFICITNFAYLPDGNEKQIVSFSGQEWDGEADEVAYRGLLEYNLKVN